jgi:hypothetical protein
MAPWTHATFVSAVLVLSGCSSKRPPGPPPDKAKMAAMTSEERCAATEPRAAPCASHLVTAELALLTSISYDEAEKLSPEERLSGSAAQEIHRVQCAGSDGYPDAVVACWQETSCKAFARCVVNASGPSKAPRP